MLTRDEVVEKLKVHREELKTFGVKSIWVFGSVARGDAQPGSDVDLLVDLDDEVSLFGFIRLRRRLRELLGVRVDLTTEDALRDSMRETVLAEAVRAA
jgi:predicted nucleotidyltransferase